MSDLVVQTNLLESLEQDLADIVAEYEHAGRNSDDMADIVGHVVLGDRIREFSTTWDDRRKNMTEQVKALHAQVKATREGFVQVDAELGKALEEGAKKS